MTKMEKIELRRIYLNKYRDDKLLQFVIGDMSAEESINNPQYQMYLSFKRVGVNTPEEVFERIENGVKIPNFGEVKRKLFLTMAEKHRNAQREVNNNCKNCEAERCYLNDCPCYQDACRELRPKKIKTLLDVMGANS